MQDLLELSTLLSRHKNYKPEVLRAHPGWTEEYERLFKSLSDRTYHNDLEAFGDLFNGDQRHKNKYSILKSRLRKRLINSLYLLDVRPATHSQQSVAFYEVHHLLFASNVLERFSTGNMATDLAETGLAIAEEYEFTQPAISFLSLLRRDASFQGNKRLFKKYDEQLTSAIRLLAAEAAIVKLYQELAIHFTRTASPRPGLLERAQQIEAEALELVKSVGLNYAETERAVTSRDSYTLRLYTFRIQMLAAQIARRYEEGIQIADVAVGYLESKPAFANVTRKAEFVLHQLLCNMHLRKYDDAFKVAAQCEALFRKGGIAWMIFRENYYLLLMHTERYDEARATLREVTSNAEFVLLPEEKKERWRVYEFYLSYILRHTSSQLTQPEVSQRTMTLRRLLKEVPNYARDKGGHNISLLILQILYLLEQKKFDAITLRIDALKSYRLRYLQPGTNRQSAIFFKLLLIMEEASFVHDDVIKKSKHYFQLLQAAPSDYSEYEEALQIIPLDRLWLHILGILKKGEHKARREREAIKENIRRD